jgi:GT2 family glycosyltransferase
MDPLIKFDLTLSVVLYKPKKETLEAMMVSVKCCTLNYKLYLIDNSPEVNAQLAVEHPRIQYIFTGENIGFGKGHNIALRLAMNESRFHVVLNPDIRFEPGVLEKLFRYMERSSEVGLLMPKVLNLENEIQYLCKQLPSPLELFVRRFIPVTFDWVQRRLDAYEMKDKNYESVFEAPYLSGCFMFLRMKSLQEVGLFDERYFMYMEDIDLSRRIYSRYKNVYYPHVHVYHEHARESYKSFRLLKIHVISAIRYFNKWGWIFDGERRRLNQPELQSVPIKSVG